MTQQVEQDTDDVGADADVDAGAVGVLPGPQRGPVESTGVRVEVDPHTGSSPVEPVDQVEDDGEGLGPVLAVPAAGLLLANGASVVGSTALHVGGSGGLTAAAVTAAVVAAGGAWAAGAHRRQAVHQSAATGSTGGPGRAGRAPGRLDRGAGSSGRVGGSSGRSWLARPGSPARAGSRTVGRGPVAGSRSTGLAGRGAVAGWGRGAAGRLAGRVAGSGPVRAARSANARLSAPVGRATHAVAGSRPARAAGAGLRAGAAGARGVTSARRAGSAGLRSGLARRRSVQQAIRQARAQGPAAAARAARQALAAARPAGGSRVRRVARALGRAATVTRAWTGTATRRAGGPLVRAGGRLAGRAGRRLVEAVADRLGLPAPQWRRRDTGQDPQQQDPQQQDPQQQTAGQAQQAGQVGGLVVAHAPVSAAVAAAAGPARTSPAPASTHAQAQGQTQVQGQGRGGIGMSGISLGGVLEDLSGQMAAAAAAYEPDGMLQWGRDMRSLENVLENIAHVLRGLEHGADGLPLEPAVKASLSNVAGLQHACSSAAGEIHTTFRGVHADDLARLEAPRPAEAKWDVRANQ